MPYGHNGMRCAVLSGTDSEVIRNVGESTWSVTVPTPLPPWWVSALTGAVALFAVASAVVPRVSLLRKAMFAFTVLGTITHEAGHGLASVVTGGGVQFIEIHSPDSGRTWTWYPSWPSAVVTTAAGYAAPPLAGLGFAALLAQGKAPMVLALTVAAMALVLVVSRDVLTVASVVTVGAVAFVVVRWGSVEVQHWVAYTETWLLLLSELAGLWAIVKNRLRGVNDVRDDARTLAADTHIPALVWIAGWVALNCWVLWKAVPLLWP